jgi:hypothetical protein
MLLVTKVKRVWNKSGVGNRDKYFMFYTGFRKFCTVFDIFNWLKPSGYV